MPETSSLMRGKRGLIMGVANNRSIAWGIARACRDHGADLAFTYQGEALKKRVEPLAEEVDGLVVGHCDVTDPASIDAVFAAVKSAWGSLDFVLHAIAFSDKDQLDGRYVDTTEDNFTKTMLVSCYSFTAVAQRAEKLMTNGGSLLTLTYYGAEKWMPHYNVMGLAKAALESSVRYLAADLGVKNIRVNAISSGPIKTLAASGIGDFRYILKWNEYNTPLRRNVTLEDVGKAGVFFLSDMSSGVTGEIQHVDAGYHIVGIKHPDAPDFTVGEDDELRRRCRGPPSITSVTAKPTGTSQAACKAAATCRSMRAAARKPPLRRNPARPVRARRPRSRRRSIMSRARSARLRNHGAGRAPRSVLPRKATGASRGFPKSPSATGRASPSRNCTSATRRASPSASTTNGISCRRAARATRWSSARMRDWYESLARDTVVTAHGGTARGLIAYLGIAKPAAAPLLDIEQGVVYVFEGEKLTRYV